MNTPIEVLQWVLSGKPGTVHAQRTYQTNTGYNQLCIPNNSFLTYGTRKLGINLVWTQDQVVRKTHFRKQDGSDGEILTGETVAFGIGGSPSFLYYRTRNVGINLKWSEAPKFEWQLFTESGNKGERIQLGQRVALLNLRVEPNPDFLVHFERAVGINLGWTTSPDWTDVVKAAISDFISDIL